LSIESSKFLGKTWAFVPKAPAADVESPVGDAESPRWGREENRR
jgi:hypothetical protein